MWVALSTRSTSSQHRSAVRDTPSKRLEHLYGWMPDSKMLSHTTDQIELVSAFSVAFQLFTSRAVRGVSLLLSCRLLVKKNSIFFKSFFSRSSKFVLRWCARWCARFECKIVIFGRKSLTIFCRRDEKCHSELLFPGFQLTSNKYRRVVCDGAVGRQWRRRRQWSRDGVRRWRWRSCQSRLKFLTETMMTMSRSRTQALPDRE